MITNVCVYYTKHEKKVDYLIIRFTLDSDKTTQTFITLE